MNEHFLKNKVHVQESDKTMVVGPKLGGKCESFDCATGRVWLTGLEGSGRSELARLLAQDLSMRFLELEHAGQDEPLAPALQTQGVVVSVTPDIAAEPEPQATMKSTGRVFYLMADVRQIMARLGVEASGYSALVQTHRAVEPKLMAGLHYLIVPDEPNRQVEQVRRYLGLASL